MKTSTTAYDAEEFSGKRILVSGGTKGIGEAIVTRLQAGGGKVLTTARRLPSGDIPPPSFKPMSARGPEQTTSSGRSSTALAVSTF